MSPTPPSWRDLAQNLFRAFAHRGGVGLRQLGRLLQGGVEFLYPPECRLCSMELPGERPDHPPGSVRSVFCGSCLAGLRTHLGPTCRRCGAGIGPYADPEVHCLRCRGDSFAFHCVVRLGVYEGLLKEAVLEGKRRGGEGLLAGLAELAFEANAAMLRELGCDVVIPVPLHHWQALFRPHNPAALLAETWGRRLNIPVATHILRKLRWTAAQARLSPTRRRENLREAFQVAAGRLPAGATVLLADDVLTTGTTAHEAARVLRRSGAARVVVAVLARGLGS